MEKRKSEEIESEIKVILNNNNNIVEENISHGKIIQNDRCFVSFSAEYDVDSLRNSASYKNDIFKNASDEFNSLNQGPILPNSSGSIKEINENPIENPNENPFENPIENPIENPEDNGKQFY